MNNHNDFNVDAAEEYLHYSLVYLKTEFDDLMNHSNSGYIDPSEIRNVIELYETEFISYLKAELAKVKD